MNAFVKFLGFLLILGGIAAGVYFDFWVLFIGGIVEFITGITANPTSVHDIVWGAVKATMLTGIGSVATFFLPVLPGFLLCGVNMKRKLRRRY